MRHHNPTRQQSQDLILLANHFLDNLVPGTMSMREFLDALHESGLVISLSDDKTAHFALQLLDNPSLQQYDPSIEVLV
jgi:hypothetical protein